MELKDLIQKTFGAPDSSTVPGMTAQETLQAAMPAPKVSKNDSLAPNIVAEAQATFAKTDNPQNPQSQPGNPPVKGTAGAMIPPGWSSQAGK